MTEATNKTANVAAEQRAKSNGVELIAAERLRQLHDGVDLERENPSDLMSAAGCHLDVAHLGADAWHSPDGSYAPPGGWPWENDRWEPSGDRVRDLAIAGALIAAALDALTPSPDERRI